MTTDHLTRTDVNDEALADARLENNWLVPVGRTRGTVNIPWSTHSGAHVEAAPNGERRRGLGFQTAASVHETGLSRREEIGSSSLHLLHTLAFLLSWWERGLFLLLSLFLSPSTSFALSFSSPSFGLDGAVVCLPLPGEFLTSSSLSRVLFLAPRCTRDSTASFFLFCLVILSTIGFSLSLSLCSSSRSRDIVSLSFDSQKHCIYRCIREISCEFQRICFYLFLLWFRIHEHVNRSYRLMREYVCCLIVSLIIRNHESEEI